MVQWFGKGFGICLSKFHLVYCLLYMVPLQSLLQSLYLLWSVGCSLEESGPDLVLGQFNLRLEGLQGPFVCMGDADCDAGICGWQSVWLAWARLGVGSRLNDIYTKCCVVLSVVGSRLGPPSQRQWWCNDLVVGLVKVGVFIWPFYWPFYMVPLRPVKCWLFAGGVGPRLGTVQFAFRRTSRTFWVMCLYWWGWQCGWRGPD